MTQENGSPEDRDAPLRGKVAIITGSTTGIGQAISQSLAEHGADIAAVYRTESGVEPLRALLEPHGGRFAAIYADLGNRADVAYVVPKTVAALGRIDILVNNAAVPHVQEFLDQTDEEWDHTFDVNLRAPFVLSREAARVMISQGEGGRIVNLSSSAAFRTRLAPVAYTSSKAGIGGLTHAAAGALGRFGILVNAVAPGLTATPTTSAHWGDDMTGAGMVTEGPLANVLGRVAEPEDIASVVTFLCLPASRNVTGQVIHASGGAIV